MPQYEQLAAEFCAAIKKIAQSEDALNNFESYLGYHFAPWMEKYAGYPEGLTSELVYFASLYDYD